MATRPQFSSTPVVGSALLSATADSSYTAPTHTVTLLTATGPRQFNDGSVTSGSYTLTSATHASFQNGDVGRPVIGTGIPAGTVIASVTSTTKAVMSKPATATHATAHVTVGGGLGMKIEQVIGVGAGTTVAGMCNFFLKDAAGSFHFVQTMKITAVTPSTSTAPFGATVNTTSVANTWRPTNLWLPPNWSLCATSFVASQHLNVTAYGGAF